MASYPVYHLRQIPGSKTWLLEKGGSLESSVSLPAEQLPSVVSCFDDQDTQTAGLIELQAVNCVERPISLQADREPPGLCGVDDETVEDDNHPVHNTPRTATTPREGAVRQTEGLQQAKLQHASRDRTDTFHEPNCFGSPMVPSPLQSQNPDHGRSSWEATHGRAVTHLPTGSDAIRLQDLPSPQASAAGLNVQTPVKDAFPAANITARQIQPQASRDTQLEVDQQDLAFAERKATQAAVQGPFVPSALSLLVAPMSSAENSDPRAKKDPSTPLRNGPSLPSCFRMDESTPSKSPADSAPDYFPSPEMTQKEAERPSFLPGRQSLVTPQIKGFSRGAGLILPTTDVHPPQREQTPVPFRMGPSKHAGQQSPLLNQQLGLESPLLRKSTPQIPPQTEPMPWQSIADPQPSGPETSLLRSGSFGPIHPSLPLVQPSAAPGFMSFQNLRTGKAHAGKRSEKAARVHALLDEVLEDDKPRELFEAGGKAGPQSGGEKGFEFGFSNGLRKKVGFSNASWARAQNLLQEELPSLGNGAFPGGGANMHAPNPTAGFENGQASAGMDFGFTNGLGAKIGFSDAAWGKAQNLMREERVQSGGVVAGRPGGPNAPMGFENGPQAAGSDFGLMTETGKNFGQSSNAFVTTKASLPHEVGAAEWRGLSEEQVAGQAQHSHVGLGLAEEPAFDFGFTTGSGRKVGVSETARKKAQSLLQEELGLSGLQGFQQGLAQAGREGLATGLASGFNQGFAQAIGGPEMAGLTSGFTRGVARASGVGGAMGLEFAGAEGPAEKGLDFGFTSGSGKKVGFSSAAYAKAQALLRDEMGQSDLGRFSAEPGTVGGLADGQSFLRKGEKFANEAYGLRQGGQGGATTGLTAFEFDVPTDPQGVDTSGGWRADGQASGTLVPVGQQPDFSRTPEPQADGFSISFQTGSLKPLVVTPAELQRGRAFFGTDGAELGFGNPGPDDVSMTSPSFQTGVPGEGFNLQGGANAAAFGGGGFQTGGLKPLQGVDAKKMAWAKRLLDEDDAPLVTGGEAGRTHRGNRSAGAAGSEVPGEPLRLGWQQGDGAPLADAANWQEGAHSFGAKRQRVGGGDAVQPGEPLRLGWQGPGAHCEDEVQGGVNGTGFQAQGQRGGASQLTRNGQTGAELHKEKLNRALSCWALDDGGAPRAASDPKPLNPGVQHLRSGSANALAQQRLNQSGPTGVQGLGARSRQPLATIGLGNRSVITPGERQIGDKPRKLKFDSPRPLAGGRSRPPDKSPLPGPSAFKSPLLARTPDHPLPMPPSSFQQTTPPNLRQTHSPFANQSIAPPFAFDMHTPQSALVPFRFDTGDAVTGGQPGTPQIAAAQQPAPAPLHTGGPLQELHDMYRGVKRPSLREAFREAPGGDCDVSKVAVEVRLMTSDSASAFRFCDAGTGASMGHPEMRQDLLRAGAEAKHATRDWVENHYRWIVWKLAGYERSFPGRCAGRMLTAERVFDQLKYRYQREIKEGQRSALKQICEKDQPPSRLMVLCISAVRSWGLTVAGTPANKTPSSVRTDGSQRTENNQGRNEGVGVPAKVEVTDGWYWLTAQLDMPLTRLLHEKKLRVGQKIKVFGSALEGLADGAPPLEACTMSSLVIRMNGTHRCRWDEKLGFCKSRPMAVPLKRIKEGGGTVPLTAVVVTRMYPMLYMEKLPGGQRVMRSAKAEDIAKRRFEESRATVAEEVAARMEGSGSGSGSAQKARPSEGARLHAELESAADPEGVFQGMSEHQRSALQAFQQQQQETMQADYTSAVDEELQKRGLEKRDVSSNLRVRVAGIHTNEADKLGLGVTSLVRSPLRSQNGEAIITIWRPSDEQIQDLAEGALYLITNLVSKAKGSGPPGGGPILMNSSPRTKWQRVPTSAVKHMTYTYHPREAVRLSTLDETPVGSEFDTAAYVLLCTAPRPAGARRQQWLFVTDGSLEGDCYGILPDEIPPDADGTPPEPDRLPVILALDVSLPADAFVPLDGFRGSVVALANVRRLPRDEQCGFGRGAASEVTVVSGNVNGTYLRHLKEKAAAVGAWAGASAEIIKRAEAYVSSIVGREAGGAPSNDPAPQGPPLRRQMQAKSVKRARN
ncbi:DNA recombinational repair protein BRCA2 [Klebsormidium nitens]|uniref:DNA recombinational repair protein BRCA2 n=1 Tax=Klebsormidium nitens TaxID=105231 RepID=A0A1Y1HHV0_KLENI|nr:DNA recombinational repair protein BRCA2 [Klebsormidium nitens]|eukprot:GAQ78035.1 DNA recombinational repair protein BRCA2 [Klebsormidium nitens]